MKAYKFRTLWYGMGGLLGALTTKIAADHNDDLWWLWWVTFIIYMGVLFFAIWKDSRSKNGSA